MGFGLFGFDFDDNVVYLSRNVTFFIVVIFTTAVCFSLDIQNAWAYDRYKLVRFTGVPLHVSGVWRL